MPHYIKEIEEWWWYKVSVQLHSHQPLLSHLHNPIGDELESFSPLRKESSSKMWNFPPQGNRASAETKFRPNSDCCCYCLMMWMMWDDVWLCSLVICHITSYQFEWVTTLSSQWLCFFHGRNGNNQAFCFSVNLCSACFPLMVETCKF